jgi:four helix bundle protein
MVRDFRELRIWQDAMVLAEAIYATTRVFPPEERYGLTNQLRRASVSTASCIAEGNARSSTRDYLRFLSMSSGSLAEIETQLLLARRFGYLNDDDTSLLLTPLHSLARQLQALKKALSARLADSQMVPVPRPQFPGA